MHSAVDPPVNVPVGRLQLHPAEQLTQISTITVNGLGQNEIYRSSRPSPDAKLSLGGFQPHSVLFLGLHM